ncbi:MAG: hypothetical protein Q7S45_02055 [Candidatus Curtissbacteria bacterium]|nr:hypothetical protein [Candidatus Curtissbacteria bacterium]
MNYLLLVKESLKRATGTEIFNGGYEINENNEKRVTPSETRFTKANDPYRQVGGRNYWQLHVPVDQKPQWAKDIYGLD